MLNQRTWALPRCGGMLLAIALAAGAGSAATYTVTNTDDAGPGSLRQALLSANANPGADTVVFNIPGSGVRTIAPLTPLPELTNTVSIDGYSQPGSNPNSLANGNDGKLLIRLDGYNLTSGFPIGLSFSNAGGNTVRGLVIVRFYTGIQLKNSSASTIAGNWIGLDVDGISRGNTGNGIYVTCDFYHSSGNVIGGLSPADRNVISGNGHGIFFFPSTADYNTVCGNFIGTDASGTLPRGNLSQGIMAQDVTNIVVGGQSPAARNVISANGSAANVPAITFLAGSGHVVQGNIIGADVTGHYHLGNYGDGIKVQGAAGVTIGGAGAGNLIGNNGGHGIFLLGDTRGAVIQGNWIGTDVGQSWPMGNRGAGVYTQNSGGSLIGGATAGLGNVIQFSGDAGVNVFSGSGNRIEANSIFDNGGPGIALGATGNQPTSSPMLTAATVAYGSTQIEGTHTGQTHTAYRLEFFASPPWDPTNRPEGKQFLGTLTITTDGTGVAAFSTSLSGAPSETVITATATDSQGNTSEFSPALTPAFGPERASVSVARNTDNSLALSWPASANDAGFSLVTTTSLVPVIQWEPVLGGIVTNGTLLSLTVTNLPPTGERYFGLRKAR